MNDFDFQIQTTASDGKHTPAECVRMAKKNGVRIIAITDHDTVAGVTEAIATGDAEGVRVVPGIEISIQDHGMHLLGLGIDIKNIELVSAIARAGETRIQAAREMVRRFKEGGFAIEWDDVVREAGDATVTRPHIVAAIMKRPENAGKLLGVTTKHDFFEKYFTDQGPFYVRASQLSAKEAIELVRNAGGLAVWSHPPIPDFVGNCRELGSFLEELIDYGLDGIELFGSFLTQGDLACLEELAARHKLVVTGGSDFHESAAPSEKPWPRSATTIGEFPTYGHSTAGLVDSVLAAMAARVSPS